MLAPRQTIYLLEPLLLQLLLGWMPVPEQIMVDCGGSEIQYGICMDQEFAVRNLQAIAHETHNFQLRHTLLAKAKCLFLNLLDFILWHLHIERIIGVKIVCCSFITCWLTTFQTASGISLTAAAFTKHRLVSSGFGKGRLLAAIMCLKASGTTSGNSKRGIQGFLQAAEILPRFAQNSNGKHTFGILVEFPPFRIALGFSSKKPKKKF